MASHRIQSTFEELASARRIGIIPFITVGYPDIETTMALVPALAQCGASIIELGVPFSDPLADGATIQKSSIQALDNGITLTHCLELCGTLRKQGLETPIVFMGYYNPLLSFGLKDFAKEAQKVGLDGIIIPDLPPEESEPLRQECSPRDIDMICLLAPTSTDKRIAAACSTATGFIYCVSVAGVTGVRDQVPPGAISLVKRVRENTKLPIAVGFGVSRREHINAIAQYADAAVVGSALVNVIDCTTTDESVSAATNFLNELTGISNPSNGGT
jgi:tryptophan synthase alpha chain